jgi:hypothetical protein
MRLMVRWVLAAILMAAPASASTDALVEADSLYAAGGIANLEASLPLYAQARQARPAEYAILWKSARAHRDLGNRVKQAARPDWKAVCQEQGRTAMQLAEEAIALAPDSVEGHYYYGLGVGIYSDGVSIFTALSEGLKGKTQTSFEKAYALDRQYNRAGPILSLARFWSVLPWPLQDKKKALAYFREYEQTGFLASSAEGQVYFGELLIKLGGQANKDEARRWLAQAAQSPQAYFAEWAQRLLAELD